MKGGEDTMKNLNLKTIAGFGMAAIMAAATFIGTVSDGKKEKKIDELIDKVSKLTEDK